MISKRSLESVYPNSQNRRTVENSSAACFIQDVNNPLKRQHVTENCMESSMEELNTADGHSANNIYTSNGLALSSDDQKLSFENSQGNIASSVDNFADIELELELEIDAEYGKEHLVELSDEGTMDFSRRNLFAP